MQGHDAANQVAGLRRDPTTPHAASLLSFPVASLLADGTSDERSSAAMPGPITNDSLKLALGYVIVAAKNGGSRESREVVSLLGH